MKKGFTLIEILVVVTIFAILGVLVTRSVILTVGGSKKSESLVKIRENLDFTVGVIERQLRNANSISECPNPNTQVINYVDENGNPSSFSCVNINGSSGVGYVASGSAVLTSTNDVNIVTCSLSCTLGVDNNPDSVLISLEGKALNASSVQGADVTVKTQVSLRNY